MHKILGDFEILTDYLILARGSDIVIIKIKEKRICRIVNLAVPADHRGKIKKSKKRDKYFDLAGKLRKLCNMKVMVIPIVIGTLGAALKNLERGLDELEIGGQAETMQITALFRSARILRRALEA